MTRHCYYFICSFNKTFLKRKIHNYILLTNLLRVTYWNVVLVIAGKRFLNDIWLYLDVVLLTGSNRYEYSLDIIKFSGKIGFKNHVQLFNCPYVCYLEDCVLSKVIHTYDLAWIFSGKC